MAMWSLFRRSKPKAIAKHPVNTEQIVKEPTITLPFAKLTYLLDTRSLLKTKAGKQDKKIQKLKVIVKYLRRRNNGVAMKVLAKQAGKVSTAKALRGKTRAPQMQLVHVVGGKRVHHHDCEGCLCGGVGGHGNAAAQYFVKIGQGQEGVAIGH